MKRVFFFVFLSLSAGRIVLAQDQKPELLKQPADWEFERFGLPPSFAPEITYTGFEELRFAPGMFKKDSLDYFSYAFVASIESLEKISLEDIRTYLLRYYKGLCSNVAKDRKLVIDTSAITVKYINKKTSPGPVYNYLLDVPGVFTDGAPVKLSLEAKLLTDAVHKRTYLLFITSPQPKNALIWKKLYEVQQNFRPPLSK